MSTSPAGSVAAPLRLARSGLRLRHWPGWLAEAPALLPRLRSEVPWRQETIQVWGKRHPVPRLTCWMGDGGAVYRYSGLLLQPEPWTPLVSDLRQRVEAAAGGRFDAVLLNLYRDGHDRMGWHADDEPELDPEAPIASLSLGASRRFQLRSLRRGENGRRETVGLDLGDGDLLLMDPPTQRHWQHQLPARRGVQAPRLNLTFRRLLRSARLAAGASAPVSGRHLPTQ
ncbi:MAG: alpha-ketoglutarate-dependent dioxygenase AlkB family protein [Cyanobacteriota bacterium]